MKVKSESEVAQLCLTLSDPMDCSLPGSSAHGIFQARVLEWVAIAFSNMLSRLVIAFLPRARVSIRRNKKKAFSYILTGEGNGPYSSTLAWKIPWTEEPGRLQSMGSLRVGHD